MEKKSKVLRKLFFSTLYLSTFTFGGGYVIVTLMKNKFVDELHWIDEEEMLDLVAIAQSSPGAIAVNGAIVVGYKLAGIPGVLCSILGAILPPMIILRFYEELSLQEISEVTKTNLSTVKSRLYAALKKLQKGLEEINYEKA